MKPLFIGDLKIEVPIIQGGMGVGISLSGLATAVANEGGVGVIASVGVGLLEDDFKENYQDANQRALRNEIRKAKANTKGVIGLNVMMALTDYKEILNIAMEEKVDLLILGAGLPTDVPNIIGQERLKESNVKIIPIVSSGIAAKIILRKWDRNFGIIPDAFIVEGPLAGGHLGYKPDELDHEKNKLENLIPKIIAEIKPFEEKYNKVIPLIAAGGIYTGKDIYDIFKLGVKGVQLGTRFVATTECDATDEFKNAYVKCKKEDIVVIQSPVGLPGRAINNEFLKHVHDPERPRDKCPWVCLSSCDIKKAHYCIGMALANAKKGDLDHGYAFAGANAYRIDKIVPVKELMTELVEGFEAAEKEDK
ncbi:MAG: nitronate monooxygenase family protein [Candidatus Delongbacteria bacterium]|nr:nitronate monooxygenase family protein [Candidatus Delongbacteria bacterium]